MSDVVPINLKLTAAGAALALNVPNTGIAVVLTHLVFGSGQYTPAVNGGGQATQTALVNRKEKTLLRNGVRRTPSSLKFSVQFSPYGGTAYNVGEVGVYAGDPDAGGVLFGVYSAPSYIHTYRNDQFSVASSFGFTFAGIPDESVTIVLDPAAAGIESAINNHNADPAANAVAFNAFRAIYGPFAGEVREWYRATTPNLMWVFADGKQYANSEYPEAAAIYSTNGTTFKVPDRRSRVAVGAGTGVGLSARGLNQVGGTETVALTEAQMPIHKHLEIAVANDDNGLTNALQVASQKTSGSNSEYRLSSTANPATVGLSGPAGGGQAHNNMQPFLVCNFIVFVGTSTSGSAEVPDDATPNSFDFADRSAGSAETAYSNAVTITGINVSVPISIQSPQPNQGYRKNGGVLTTAPGTVSNLDVIELIMTSDEGSGTGNRTRAMTILIGGVPDTWTVSFTAVHDANAGSGSGFNPSIVFNGNLNES